MATARNAPSDPPEGTEGFSPTQKTELAALIAEAVKGAKPPEAPPAGPPGKTDDEWDAMSDRQRESWVRGLVDFRLDELSRDDETRRLAAEVEALKAGVSSAAAKPEVEKSPGMVSKLQKLLWGRPDE